MSVVVAAFVGIGVICTLIANLPFLVQQRNADRATMSRRRLAAFLAAQSLLFAGYGLLLGYLQQEQKVSSLAQAAMLGGMLALIPVLIGYQRDRAQLIRSVATGFSIIVCSVAAFLIAPIVGGN